MYFSSPKSSLSHPNSHLVTKHCFLVNVIPVLLKSFFPFPLKEPSSLLDSFGLARVAIFLYSKTLIVQRLNESLTAFSIFNSLPFKSHSNTALS